MVKQHVQLFAASINLCIFRLRIYIKYYDQSHQRCGSVNLQASKTIFCCCFLCYIMQLVKLYELYMMIYSGGVFCSTVCCLMGYL